MHRSTRFLASSERRSSPRASSEAGLRSSSLLRGAPPSISNRLSACFELTLFLPRRSKECLGRRRAGSLRASALRGARRLASSVSQTSTGPSSELSGDASSRSEKHERGASLRLTVGLGSSPLRTMSHFRIVSPALGERPPPPSEASIRSSPRRSSASRSSRKSSSANDPSMGFRPLRRLLDTGSDTRRAYLSRLRSAFRFSQPLDALLRPRPYGLVSCRIRPWGSDLQRLPPPTRRHDFRRALPLLPFVAPQRVRLQGFRARGRSVRVGSVLPGARRPILSWLFHPLKGFPSSLGLASLQSLLSWAFHNAGSLHRCDRSPEFQRTQG